VVPSHRPFQETDAAAICRFPQSAEELFFMFPQATYPLTPDQLRAAVRWRHEATVALLDGRIAAYADFEQIQENHFCTLGSLVVQPQHRREGLAVYLAGAMVQTALERHGARFVRASCFSHNKAAYALYYKLGFKPADLALRTGPDQEPLLLVHMHLSARAWLGSR
jgi:RimJ/RimL family protein N-acetyltransferase